MFKSFSLRRWLYKPRKSDLTLLAQFYYADEDLNRVASELDSFDGRKDPERCTALVNQLRACQDKVLNTIQSIMEEVIPQFRVNRDFRVKFPDDVVQENLSGQLWFGAECLAAGSSIMNREHESAGIRPLARALTRTLDNLRAILREQALRNTNIYTDTIKASLYMFDQLFAEFELSYVSAMVPVKTAREYDTMQDVTVLFSETVLRAISLSLVTMDMIDDYDPALMFTIPRLAIICGLLINPEGPINPDMDSNDMSEMFRPFQTLLFKIRQLLRTLSEEELLMLERALCSLEEPGSLKPTDTVMKVDQAVCTDCELAKGELELHCASGQQKMSQSVSAQTIISNPNYINKDIPPTSGMKHEESRDSGICLPNSSSSQFPCESNSEFVKDEPQCDIVTECSGGASPQKETADIVMCSNCKKVIRCLAANCDSNNALCPQTVEVDLPSVSSICDDVHDGTVLTLDASDVIVHAVDVPASPQKPSSDQNLSEDILKNSPESTAETLVTSTGNSQHSSNESLSEPPPSPRSSSPPLSCEHSSPHKEMTEEQSPKDDDEQSEKVLAKDDRSCSTCQTGADSDWDRESCDSTETSSYNSDCHDDEEITLAIQAAELASRYEARSRFRSSSDLIHRLFVCISGVADQLQTNYASDLRNILRAVFEIHSSEPITSIHPQPCKSSPGAERQPRYTSSNRGQSIVFEEPPAWVPDEQSPQCMACKVPFTLVRRRHHCRNCGKIYCSRCSSNFVPLPHFGHMKAVRVCNRCYMYQCTPFTTDTT